MNILILTLYASTKTEFSEGIGGAQEVIHQLGKRWVKMGHNVRIISAYRDKNIPKKEIVDGIEIERVCSFYTAIYGIKKVYKKYEEWADIVLENYTSYPIYTPLYVRKSLFVIMHHLMGKEYIKASGLQGLIGYLSEKLIPYIYNRTKFIAVSDFAKKQLLSIGIPEKNINVIYNGIDLDEYMPAEKSKDPLIFFVGNFIDGRKRVEDLIEAFKIVNKKIPDAKLVIAGYGGKRENLIKKLIKNNNNIEFLGRIDENKKKKLYQKAWIFVNPSIMEGFSLTALEAHACGTPVIAYKIDGLETVIDGVNGLVVKKINIKALANTIIKIVEDDKLRNELSRNARETSEMYSWDIAAKRYLDVFWRGYNEYKQKCYV